MADAEILLAGLLARTEQEKTVLARQLHGELGGTLAAARMSLSALRAVGTDASVLAQVDAQLAAAQALKQRLVEALHPSLLDHFGLGVALPAQLEAACRAAGVPFIAAVEADLPALLPEPAILLYRLGEQVGQLMLGGRPRSLDLALSAPEGGLCLRLRCAGAAPALGEDPGIAALGHWLIQSGGRFRAASTDGSAELEAMLP